MANRYWVGGTGTWDTTTTTNWSATTGGAGGASAPTSADSVVIDTSSGTGTITCTAGVCLDLTVTATQAIILGAASSTLSVYGSLIFPATGSFSVISSSTITFASTTTGKTITTNGKSLGGIIFNGVGGGWTLGSALVSGATLTLTNGTLDTSSTSNYSFSVSNGQLNAGTKTLNLNASTVSVVGNINFATNGTGFTLNAGTSTITFTGGSSALTTGGFTYYNVTWTGSYIYTPQIVGSATYNNLSINYATVGNFIHYISGTQTVNGTFTVRAGSATNPITIAGGINIVGTQGTIVANAVSSLSYINFRDIVISGNAISGGNLTGTNLGNCGNNSGITFPASKTVYWNLPAGGNWYSNAWALTSGGTVNLTNTPLPQDSVIIQDTGLNSGATITLTNQHNGDIDFSSRTLPMTLAVGASVIYWYGNIKYSSAVTITGTGQFIFSKQNATQQITSSGITHPIQITVNTPATVQLQDAFTTASTVSVTLTQGTLDANNYNVTTGLFSSSNSNVRTLNMGSGTWTITASGQSWNFSTTTNLTFNIGTSTIAFTGATAKTLSITGSLTFYNMSNSNGTLSFSNGTTFNNLTCFAGSGIIFTSGPTFRANTFTFVGTPSSPITIAPSSTTNYALTKLGGGIVDMQNVSISRCTASPSTGTWYAGASTDGGNNTGIRFVSAPKFQQMF